VLNFVITNEKQALPLAWLYSEDAADANRRERLLGPYQNAPLSLYCSCGCDTTPLQVVGPRPLCLAPVPGTDSLHRPTCYFSNALAGTSSFFPRSLYRDCDGVLNVRGWGGRAVSPFTPYHSVSLTGLLHILWAEARLHRWIGATPRSLQSIRSLLLSVSRRIRIAGHSLHDSLLLPSPGQTFSVSPSCSFILGRHEDFAHDALFWALLSQSPHLGPFAHCSDLRLNTWLLLHVAHESGALRLIDLAGLSTTPDGLPCGSAAVRDLLTYLCAQRRVFDVPLSFGIGSDVFPSVFLNDVDPQRPFPLEIWLQQSPEYFSRRAAKTAFNTSNFGPPPSGWWEWDACAMPSVPPLSQLPPPVSPINCDDWQGELCLTAV